MLSVKDMTDLMAMDAFIRSISERSGSIAPELFAAFDTAMEENDEEAVTLSLQKLLDAAEQLNRKDASIQQELAERMLVIEAVVQKMLDARAVEPRRKN